MAVKPKVAETGYCVYTRRSVLTLQWFTYQCIWQIHKAIMHTCTVDGVYVCVCLCGALLHVCRDCVTGPQCTDSTKVTRTMFFVLASLLPLCLTHHFRSTFHHLPSSLNRYSRSVLQSVVQKNLTVLESSLIADPRSHTDVFATSWNWNFWDLLTAAEIGQVCLSVNAGRTLKCSQILFCSVFTHLLHFFIQVDCSTALHEKLCVQTLGAFFFIWICITPHLFKSKLALQVFNTQQEMLNGRQWN